MHSFDMSVPPGRFVQTEGEARQWIDHFLKTHKMNDGLGLDTETTGLDKIRDRPLFWSLSDGQSRICLSADFLPLFKQPLLENPEVSFDLTRAKFDGWMLYNAGIDIRKAKALRDTSVQDWLLNENKIGRHGLKETVTEYFGRKTPEFTDVFGEVPKKKIDKVTGKNLSKTVGDLVREGFADPARMFACADYASLDAYNSTSVRKFLDNELEQVSIGGHYGNLKRLYHEVSSPFTKVLLNCEIRGMTADKGHLMGLQGPMEKRMEEIVGDFNQAATRLSGAVVDINLDSTTDMRWFFFDLLKKEPSKMTKGGAKGVPMPSTDADVLDKWAGEGDEWAGRMKEYRIISKIYGTYVVGLQKWLDPEYRIHTSINQTGAVTGRLSSSEPNLQNIPRPDTDRFKVRDAFIPREGKILVVADYEQLEMRIMAHFSKDPKMIHFIMSGMDLHAITASEMYGPSYDDIMAAKKHEGDYKKGKRQDELTSREVELLGLRQAAKRTGFGIIYGIGGLGLSAQLTEDLHRVFTPQEGNALIQKWFGVFDGCNQYIEGVKNRIFHDGYVQTLLGRYRRFGDLRAMGNSQVAKADRARALRQGGNAEIQGSASDIAMMAMIHFDNDPDMKKIGSELLMQIHDELIVECWNDPECIAQTKKRLVEIMEHPLPEDLIIPLPASCGHGWTWASAK